MKSTVVYIPKPSMMEFEPFFDQQKWLDEIKKAGYCYVDVMEHSKTTLRISIRFGLGMFSINKMAHKNLKYLTAFQRSSIWDDNKSTLYYLKKSNGLAGLKLHLDSIFSGLGFETMEFKVYKTLPINEMLAGKQTINEYGGLFANGQ